MDLKAKRWAMSPGYFQGVFWALMTALVAVLNDVITKFVGTRLDGLEISFFRFFFSMMTVLPFMLTKGAADFKTTRPMLHLVRALLGVAAIGLYIYSLILLPLAEVVVFSFTQPLFFLPVALIFLGEKVPLRRWIAAGIGFVGICILIRPGTPSFNPYTVVPMISALMFAILDMLAKKMVIKESTKTLLFYFALGTTVASLGPALWVWKSPTGLELFWMFCLGAGANLIQVCLFKALSATQASRIAPFRYTELLFSIIFGYVFFNEIPSGYVLGGAALIIASTVTLAHLEARREKKLSEF